jgi:hypothetical protein
MAITSGAAFPRLRSFDDSSSYPYTVGADHEFLKRLHGLLEDRAAAKRLTAKQLRDDLRCFAEQIREHVEWLNKATIKHEADVLHIVTTEPA